MTEQEQEAITTLRGGDISGLETLVRLFQLPATRTAYAILGNRQAAEDVAADAFLTLYNRIGQYNPQRPFAPWFYRIVVNAALKAARAQKRTPSPNSLDPDWLDLPSNLPGPEEEAAMREMRLLLLSAIYTLPPHQRAAIVLRYYLDMDEATMAHTLGCPLGTVKWRLHAAKQRLRRTLLPQLE